MRNVIRLSLARVFMLNEHTMRIWPNIKEEVPAIVFGAIAMIPVVIMYAILRQVSQLNVVDLDSIFCCVVFVIAGITLGLLAGIIWPFVTCLCYDKLSRNGGAAEVGWILVFVAVPTYMIAGGLIGLFLTIQ